MAVVRIGRATANCDRAKQLIVAVIRSGRTTANCGRAKLLIVAVVRSDRAKLLIVTELSC